MTGSRAIGPGGANSLVRSSYIVVIPLPEIFAPALNANLFQFSFDTIPGKTYHVEFTDSLDNPDWQPLQSITGDGSAKNITCPISSPGQRFFRLHVE